MDSPSQALSRAASTTSWAVGMCDNFVANMFGYSSSGYYTALSHWNSLPANDKHPGDMNAPAGALMFWGGGQGHVAISDGKGGIYTTDMPSRGNVSLQPADSPSSVWHKPYLGWSIPVFNGQTGTTGAAYSGPGTASLTVPASSSTLMNAITGAFGINTTDILERGALMLFGAVLVIIGLWKFTGAGNKVIEVIGGATKSQRSEGQSDNGKGVRKEEGGSSVLRDGEQGEGERTSEKEGRGKVGPFTEEEHRKNYEQQRRNRAAHRAARKALTK